MSLGNLSRHSDAITRSISAENPTGEKGSGGMATTGYGARAARNLGQGWKVAPAVWLADNATITIAEIDGPGAIQSMWFAGLTVRRECILRIYWDGQEHPSVECPMGDFFAVGWGIFSQINSLPVAVNPNNGVTSYWEMPFRKSCRITLENRSSQKLPCYYQINYTLTKIPDDADYFHAQFRRNNPLPYKEVHTILDGVTGRGHYVGTAMAWGVNNDGWWGAGEIKFYLDGDIKFPTICGTGTEDYFGGAYNWDVDGQYQGYSTPYLGMYRVLPDGTKQQANQRFGLYRWHVMDPVRFQKDVRVTIQALGWVNDPAVRYLPVTEQFEDLEATAEGRYKPLQDDISSVAFWYQELPTTPFPTLPDVDYLEIV